MSKKLKKSLLLLVGAAITLSACNEVTERSGQTITTVSPSPAVQPSPTLNQNPALQKTTTSTQTERQNYKPISLSEIADTEARVGSDPKALALSAFGNTETEGGSQQVTVNYPQPNQAVIIITQLGVADDSVRGIRYRAEFVPKTKSAQTQKQWEIVWAGSQVTCQPGRGHQDWSKELCL
ncbi:MAG: hypothetical protein F6K28_36395 [Microcoleus sp. SIO2G3]|nr:hypothetical protein [Microcoleus sp. SIO2G3]